MQRKQLGRRAGPTNKAAGFTKAGNHLLLDTRLSDGAFRTLLVLRHHARQSPLCWPGEECLAKERGLSARTIRRHLQELQARGLVRVRPQGSACGTNLYRLVEEGQQGQQGGGAMPAMEASARVQGGQRCPPKKKESAANPTSLTVQRPKRRVAAPAPAEAAIEAKRAELRENIEQWLEVQSETMCRVPAELHAHPHRPAFQQALIEQQRAVLSEIVAERLGFRLALLPLLPPD